MATQQEHCDFESTRRHARRLSEIELAWTIRDCQEAARIHDEMDAAGIPNNSGRYWDQCNTYADELERRRTRPARRTA